MLIALLLAPLAMRLRLPRGQRAALLFVLIFVVEGVLPAVELLFFSTGIVGGIATGIVAGAVVSAVQAVLLAWLLPAPAVDRLEEAAARALHERPWWSWALRAVPD